MSLTAKLANPTPWNVELPYEKGICIVIPAFGFTSLTMQQLDDMRGGKPGSEAINLILDYDGLFIVDSDRPYDHQALEALKRCHRAKKAQHEDAVKDLISKRAAAGVGRDPEALEEVLRLSGQTELRNKINELQEQITAYAATIDSETERSVRHKLDPMRTIFVMDPPTEFPSVAAMNFFLDLPRNAELQNRHIAYQKAQKALPDEPLTG
jgi:hypothetical protein